MTALTMSDIHAMVTSCEWHFAEFRAAMPHLSAEEAAEQYAAILCGA